jgi:preprotein translocase subunit SecD
MKHLLLTTIAAVLLVGCGQSDVWEQPDVWEAVRTGNSKALEKHLSAADTLSRKVDYGHLLLEVDIDHISEGNDTSPVFKAAKILHKRTKPYGLSDSLIKAITRNLIVVDLSTFDRGIPNGYKELLTSRKHLEFALVHKDSDTLIANEITPAGYKKYAQTTKDAQGNIFTSDVLVEVENKYGLKGEHIISTYPSRDPLTQSPMILFTFNSEGAKAMGQLSGNNVGRQMAIILDGKLMSAPVLLERITSNGQITGDFTSEEAATIANALRNPLNAPLMIIEEYADSKLSLGAALLRIAIIRNYTEIIELLIKQRPEVINAMGKNKETALDFASRNHTKVADLLRKHGGKTAEELKAEQN